MRLPLVPWLLAAALAAVGMAALYDLAMAAGDALTPWFGWMLP